MVIFIKLVHLTYSILPATTKFSNAAAATSARNDLANAGPHLRVTALVAKFPTIFNSYVSFIANLYINSTIRHYHLCPKLSARSSGQAPVGPSPTVVSLLKTSPSLLIYSSIIIIIIIIITVVIIIIVVVVIVMAAIIIVIVVVVIDITITIIVVIVVVIMLVYSKPTAPYLPWLL